MIENPSANLTTGTSSRPATTSAPAAQSSFWEGWEWYHLPPAVALASFTFMPFLIQTVGLPGGLRWVGDAAVAAMVILAFVRMLTADRIPVAMVGILALTLIGATVASFEGQGAWATVWGFWMMFKYPIVGLYVYLLPTWPKNFAQNFIKFTIFVLGLQVLVQLFQFATGTEPGDQLSGTLGRFGTGQLVLLVIFVLALALGQWLARGKWVPLAVALALGGASSVLGEMKLFPLAMLTLALVTFIIHMVRGQQLRRLVVYLLLFAVIGGAFFYAYNSVVADTRGTARLEDYLDPDRRERYLNFSNANAGSYQFGRNFAFQYGWEAIQRDETTLLFGMGLGTRRVSTAFGFVGQALQDNSYGLFVGSSILIMMQEMGLVGLTALAFFILWTVFTLWGGTRRDPHSYITALRFGVLLFTLCWPIWIWYNVAWTLAAPMLFYWIAYGYAMRHTTGLAHELGANDEEPVALIKPREQTVIPLR